MVKQVDYDKYIEMIQSNKFDNVINSLRTDIADYIVNVLKMKDKTDSYFTLNIEKVSIIVILHHSPSLLFLQITSLNLIKRC